MKIQVDNNHKIYGYAIVGNIPDSIDINEAILPSNFFDDWCPEKFLYIDGVVSEDPSFVPPEPPPEPPSLEDQIKELQEQNQMLTDCLLEMSEIVYGGDM